MNQTRRNFLRTGMAAGTVAIAAGAGLLTPGSVLAAWPKSAFAEKKLDKAINLLTGSSDLTESTKIKIDAPDIAENGAVVSVTVESSLANIESISVLVPANASPLCASYALSKQSDGIITGRIKMAKSSDIVAVIKADGKLHTSKKSVKVTMGGCGG
ncbi:Sulfur oxidation protein SoxY [hydrothermal vent metagenome]|uniref:Sulfur oxidation protein SoxY n=1 Tax=hydrothermal vent metagenome TaxID=652676 RepID=A0A3B1AKS3_9ZZZZ